MSVHPQVASVPNAFQETPVIRGTVLTEPVDPLLPVVLLVEDNAELLSFVAESLAGQYTILTAANGRVGLDIAKHKLPDVMVSDVMMPEMDGYQLTYHLKNDPITDHIAVVLLTARTAADSRQEGLEKGADDYLTRSVAPGRS